MRKLIEAEIKQTTLVRADPEKVYDGIASAEGLNTWFTHNSELDPRPGGDIVFRWKDWGPDKYTGEVVCPILEFDEPNRFVFQWWPDHYTTVEITFSDTPQGTLVEVKEIGYVNSEEGQKRMLECAVGWGEALTLLKFHVEYGIHY